MHNYLRCIICLRSSHSLACSSNFQGTTSVNDHSSDGGKSKLSSQHLRERFLTQCVTELHDTATQELCSWISTATRHRDPTTILSGLRSSSRQAKHDSALACTFYFILPSHALSFTPRLFLTAFLSVCRLYLCFRSLRIRRCILIQDGPRDLRLPRSLGGLSLPLRPPAQNGPFQLQHRCRCCHLLQPNFAPRIPLCKQKHHRSSFDTSPFTRKLRGLWSFLYQSKARNLVSPSRIQSSRTLYIEAPIS